MKLPQFIPSDLLEKIDGVEQGLTRGKRMGAFGRLGLVAAAVQFALVVLNNKELRDALTEVRWPEKFSGLAGFETVILFGATF